MKICLHKNLYTNVHRRGTQMFMEEVFIIAKKVETTTNELNKQNMVYPFNGTLPSHKKEWSIDICYTDEPWKYAKWKSQLQKAAAYNKIPFT